MNSPFIGLPGFPPPVRFAFSILGLRGSTKRASLPAMLDRANVPSIRFDFARRLAIATAATMIAAFATPSPTEAGTYTNPIIAEQGLADPDVLFHEGTYYLYPTGGTRQGYVVFTSTDLVNWTKGPRVFDSQRPGTWAPDVFFNPGDRKFYLYYTADTSIGVAVADRPEGPFADHGILLTKAIDAHLFRDDGKYFLYYVNVDRGNRILVQPMATPLEKRGEPSVIISATEPWETRDGKIAEGPWMIKRAGTYYLMYSANHTASPTYAIGYATAKNPLGPFEKFKGNPIVRPGPGVYGPGHHSVTQDAKGNWWMLYHQKADGNRNGNRFLCLDALWFDDAGVLHGKATRGTLETAPVTMR